MPRLRSVDALRGLALLAMVVAHANRLLGPEPVVVARVVGQLSALASPLFVLVLGMAAQVRADRQPAGGTVRMLASQAVRAILLVALGVWLSTWGTWVDVVLAYLGVTLLVGAPMVLLGSRWVLVVMAALLVAGDPIVSWARTQHFTGDLAQWLVTGYNYRLVSLLPFFLAGALLVRYRGDRRLAVIAAGVAPVAFAVGWLWQEHGGSGLSGSWPDTLHDIALVCAAYAVVVGIERWRGAVLEPLAALGRVALSVYVLHVAVLAWVPYTPGEPAFGSWLVVVVGVPAAGWAWARYLGTGPVEWVEGWVSGRPKPLPRLLAGRLPSSD